MFITYETENDNNQIPHKLIEDCINTNKIIIRLWGIECPNLSQEYGKQAKQFVEKLTHGKVLHILSKYKDKWDGLVSYIIIGNDDGSDGLRLNEEMIKKGYAWVYDKSCNEPICNKWKKLQAEAKKNKKGLWGQLNPIPPWKWSSPPTVDKAVEILLNIISRSNKVVLKNMKEKDLSLCHHSLGRRIRNTFSFWSGNPNLLQKTWRFYSGKTNYNNAWTPDSASMVIIKATWKKLQKMKNIK